jgi:hypothetical protein
VNDHREYGSYVGQHGLVMENGLPSKGVVSLKAESANVYELTGTQLHRAKARRGRRDELAGRTWPLRWQDLHGHAETTARAST